MTLLPFSPRTRKHATIAALTSAGLLCAFVYPAGTWANSLTDLTIDPIDLLKRLSSPWDSRTLLGHDNGFVLPFAPSATVAAAAAIVGLPGWIIGRLAIAAIFAASGLAMLLLTRTLFPSWQRGHLVAALAYLANIFVWVYAKDAAVLLLPYAATPALIAIFLRGIRATGQLRYAALFALVSVPAAGVSPPGAAIAAVIVTSMGISGLIGAKNIRWSARARYAAMTIATTFAANVWWVVPVMRNLAFHTDLAAKSVENPMVDDAYSSYPAVIRLMGNPALYSGWHGAPYYPMAPLYVERPWIIALSFVIPIMGLTGLALLICRRARHSITLGALLLAALFLAAGIQPPTGAAYLWLYNHMPGGIAFRASYRWVGALVFIYALGAAATCEAINPRRWRLAPMWLALLGIFAQGAPMFLGRVAPSDRFYNIPDYWYAYANWGNADSNAFRIAYLPGQFFSVYRWGQPLGEPAAVLSHHPAVIGQPGPPASNADGSALVTTLLRDLVTGARTDEVAVLLKVLNIKYVVERGDVDSAFYGEPSREEVQRSLAAFPFLRMVREFGPLRVYENLLWADTALRASTAAVGIARPLELDMAHPGEPTWRRGVSYRNPLADFTLRVKVRLDQGAYFGVGVAFPGHEVVAEVRSDGSRFEHSVGETMVPIGQARGVAVAPGTRHELVLKRTGTSYALAVDGVFAASAIDDVVGPGRIYLASFQSIASVAAVTRIESGASRELLGLTAGELGHTPPEWDDPSGTWTTQRLPLAQALVDAAERIGPRFLKQVRESLPDWAANALSYEGQPLGDFAASANVTLLAGGDAALGFMTKDMLIMGEIRADGSRIEVLTKGGILVRSSAVGARIVPRSMHSASVIRRGPVVTLAVDGAPVAELATGVSEPGTFTLSSFLAQAAVGAVTIAPVGQQTYRLPVADPDGGRLPPGWRGPGSLWVDASAALTPDSLSSPVPVVASDWLTDHVEPAASQPTILSESGGPSWITVRIRADSPFYLTWDAAYDSAWVGRVQSARGWSPLQHFEALGYANGWFVPTGGRATIAIRYEGNPGWSIELGGWATTCAALGIVAAWPRRVRSHWARSAHS